MERRKLLILIEVIAHLLFWGMLVYTFNSSFKIQYAKVEMVNGVKQVVMFERSLLPFVLFIITTKIIFVYLSVFYLLPEHFMGKRKNIAVVCLLLSVPLLLTVDYFALRWIREISNLTLTEIKMLMPVDIILGFFSFGFAMAYFFIRQWRAGEIKLSNLRQQQLNSELELLKSQINPHFLFNALNNIFSIAQKAGNENAAAAISKLSAFMRYLLQVNKTTQVSLDTEISFIYDYIEVMKLNYTNKEAEIGFDVIGITENVTIAPMLLIPFVENAFKHGIKIGNTSLITFKLQIMDGQIQFSGQNPCYPGNIGVSTNSLGTGLESVKNRIKMQYANAGDLQWGIAGNQFLFYLKISA